MHAHFSLTKLRLKGSYSVSKGAALCCAPGDSPNRIHSDSPSKFQTYLFSKFLKSFL